jgi:hypothetical protein
MSGEYRRHEDAKKRRQSDQVGVLGILNDMKRQGTEQREQSRSGRAEWMQQREDEARAGFDLAVAHAMAPPPEPETKPLIDRLRDQLEGLTKGMMMPQNFTGEKLSVAGTFHGAAAGQMAGGSVMDRIAKATEKSEQHLATMATKNKTGEEQKPPKPASVDQETAHAAQMAKSLEACAGLLVKNNQILEQRLPRKPGGVFA